MATDGNFPFEFKFVTPLIGSVSSFSLQARASDTGGNATWTPPISIDLLPDATPPGSLGTSPRDGIRLSNAKTVAVSFDEAINPGSVNASTFGLTFLGADGEFGTGDDAPVAGSYQFRNQDRQVILLPGQDLVNGFYRAAVTTGLEDRAGNGIASSLEFTFEITDLVNVAESGTPRDAELPSANTGQSITIEGIGLFGGAAVEFPTISTGGSISTTSALLTGVSPDGQFGFVVVPDNARTGDIVLPDGSTSFLQIVPTVTAIDGGRREFSSVYGTGFTENDISLHAGEASVVDTGGEINVTSFGGVNNRMDLTLPPDANLPYVVETLGGRSGRLNDVAAVVATALSGTPHEADEASANVGQPVTLEGEGFAPGETIVALEAMSSGGVPYITTVEPDSVAPDGKSLVFTVPEEARAGVASIMGGGSGKLLQIVPTVTSISGGRGRFSSIYGTGFIEGFVTAQLGSVEVVDDGPLIHDAIQVTNFGGVNNRMDLTIPIEARLPYVVVTEGGSSGRASDVFEIPATSVTGTPADAEEASANVGQQVTIEGQGFIDGETQVTLEAIDTGGVPFITLVATDSVSPDGTSLVFTVPPEARTGVASILSGGAGRVLQIVPTVTSISGGKGRFSSIFGTGFTEGFITARFGPAEVVDGGTGSTDGIQVSNFGGVNNRLDVTIPPEATLPYEVITEGGSSGRATDVTEVPSVAQSGTPADPAEASANVGQQVSIEGAGFVDGVTRVTLEAMDSGGTPYITTVDTDSVSSEGTSLTFTVPPEARAGVASVLNGGAGRLLQIVPTVTFIDGGRGEFSSLYGTGFIEGFVTVQCGPAEVVDGGPASNDGIQVSNFGGTNNRMDLTIPIEATLPYVVVTEGGASGRVDDLTDIVAVAAVGTPADNSLPSANVGQSVTVVGSGYAQGVTKVVLEGLDSGGTPFIEMVDPDSVAGDGTSLTFTVPEPARTGEMALLSGGASLPLQIVPTLDSVSSTTPGTFAVVRGTGFTEGFITIKFNTEQVVDGGSGSTDGVQVSNF